MGYGVGRGGEGGEGTCKCLKNICMLPDDWNYCKDSTCQTSPLLVKRRCNKVTAATGHNILFKEPAANIISKQHFKKIADK